MALDGQRRGGNFSTCAAGVGAASLKADVNVNGERHDGFASGCRMTGALIVLALFVLLALLIDTAIGRRNRRRLRECEQRCDGE